MKDMKALAEEMLKGRKGEMRVAEELVPSKEQIDIVAKMKPGAKLGKVAKSLAKGAGVLGVGLSAIELGKEAADEELERKDEAAMYKASEDQYAKTKTKILKDKTGESLKNIKSLQASTKKNTPKVKAKSAMPQPKSDEQKTKDYMDYMKKQPDMEENPFDAPVGRAMKRAAKEFNESPYGKGTDKSIEKTVRKLRGE